MLLILAIWCGAMFEFVRRVFENCGDAPRSSEGVLKFVNVAFRSIQTDSASSKYNIANGIDVGVWSMGVDKLAMIGLLFLD